MELTDKTFDGQVAGGVTIVDFWAPWCGPCRMQTPILEALAPKVQGRAVIAKVNVDDFPDLAARFSVRGIPTLILFKAGQPVQQMVGVQREDALLRAVESAAG
ncbi:MAG: thioredoxin [Kiritimatiellae bacterium]|nr:thioredoxin [Kiritimatiellia bacterium]